MSCIIYACNLHYMYMCFTADILLCNCESGFKRRLKTFLFFLCASLTIARGAVCNRPCRDVIGWSLIGHVRESWLSVRRRLLNNNRKSYTRNSVIVKLLPRAAAHSVVYAMSWCSSVCLSVWMSVTFAHCVETSKHILELLFPHFGFLVAPPF